MVAVVLGWILHDLAFYVASTEPDLALALLPGSVLAVAAAGVLGVVWSRVPWMFAALAGMCILAVVWIKWRSTGATDVLIWMPRVPLALLVTAWLCERFAQLVAGSDPSRRAEIHVGIGAGVVVCIAVAWKRDGVSFDPLWSVSIASAIAASLVVALGTLCETRSRRIGTAILAATLAGSLALTARNATALRRADQPPVRSASSSSSDATPANLLLVVLDTVRADHLAPYGHARVTTPRLDAFVNAHAIRYENARSTSSWTLPSHASLFTGLQPAEHGATRPRVEGDPNAVTLQAWPAQKMREDVPTLAERLADEGYQTAAFLANGSFLRHEYGLDRGFERYDDRKSAWHNRYAALAQLLGHHARVGFLPYREARAITDLALTWLTEERRDDPFFLTLNYMDAHAPYIPPASTRDAFATDQPRDLRSVPRALNELQYDRELLYLDSELARVLDALEELDLFDDTVVIVTSDHGEAFGEHGFVLHGWNLYDEVLRVPLYLKPRGRNQPGVIGQSIMGAEVFDLALAAVGLVPAPPLASARDTPAVIGQLHVTEYLIGRWKDKGIDDLERRHLAWIEGDIKYLVGGDSTVDAFDLSLDPRELEPLALSPTELERARAHARTWWVEHPEVRTSTPEADDSELSRLRDLGYTGDE